MEMGNKWVFIVNPTAGSGFGSEIIPDLEKQALKRKLHFDIRLTERHGHASVLAEEALQDGYTHIIAVGGDGTMNEVARPLISQHGITTGIIPAGTGNDFIQILGLPNRFTDDHWEIFFSANTVRMDVGIVNNMPFLNGMGLGFDASVAAENYVEPGEVAESKGRNKYLWHILKTLLFYREGSAIIESRGERVETSCFMNTVAIGRRFAGDFLITPSAIANDGLLDICMIKKLNLLQRIRILTMVPKGTHIRDPKIEYYQTDKLRIEFGKKVPFHVDGELYFDATFDVSVLPSALNMIYHSAGNHFFK